MIVTGELSNDMYRGEGLEQPHFLQRVPGPFTFALSPSQCIASGQFCSQILILIIAILCKNLHCVSVKSAISVYTSNNAYITLLNSLASHANNVM